jgi:hypothetical protein
MAGDDEEAIVSNSPLVRILRGVQRIIFAKAAPIADAILFFFLVFLISVAGHTFQDVYGTRQLTQTFKNRLYSVMVGDRNHWPTSNALNHTFFDGITTHDDFWDYLQYNLADVFFPAQFYDGGPIPDNQKNMVMGHSVMVQHVRLRQKRVKETECQPFPSRLDVGQLPGLKGVKCYPKYSKAVEDTALFQGLEWISDEMLMLVPRNPLQHKFQGGFFAIDIPTSNNTIFKERIQELKAKKWTDRATRAVFVDVCVLNLPRDQFVSLRFEFDFTEYGKIVPKVKIRAYRDRLQHQFFVDAVNYISEFALYSTAGANAFREFGRLRAMGPEKFFSNTWNLVVAGLLACVFMSMYYRVVIVRSQWSFMQSESNKKMKWELDANGQYNVKW